MVLVDHVPHVKRALWHFPLGARGLRLSTPRPCPHPAQWPPHHTSRPGAQSSPATVSGSTGLLGSLQHQAALPPALRVSPHSRSPHLPTQPCREAPWLSPQLQMRKLRLRTPTAHASGRPARPRQGETPEKSPTPRGLPPEPAAPACGVIPEQRTPGARTLNARATWAPDGLRSKSAAFPVSYTRATTRPVCSLRWSCGAVVQHPRVPTLRVVSGMPAGSQAWNGRRWHFLSQGQQSCLRTHVGWTQRGGHTPAALTTQLQMPAAVCVCPPVDEQRPQVPVGGGRPQSG